MELLGKDCEGWGFAGGGVSENGLRGFKGILHSRYFSLYLVLLDQDVGSQLFLQHHVAVSSTMTAMDCNSIKL